MQKSSVSAKISLHLFILTSCQYDSCILWKILYNKGLSCIWKIFCHIPLFYTVQVFGVYTGYLNWVYSRIFIIFINPLSPYCNINTLVVFLSWASSSSSGGTLGYTQSSMIMVMWPMDVCKRITSRTHSLRLSCVLRIHQTSLGSLFV